MTHDCAHAGHVWLEADGQPYRRHRGREPGSIVSCTCEHCGEYRDLPGHGAFTAPPGPHPVDHRIPAPFMSVLDRAVAAAPKDTGPASVDSD